MPSASCSVMNLFPTISGVTLKTWFLQLLADWPSLPKFCWGPQA